MSRQTGNGKIDTESLLRVTTAVQVSYHTSLLIVSITIFLLSLFFFLGSRRLIDRVSNNSTTQQIKDGATVKHRHDQSDCVYLAEESVPKYRSQICRTKMKKSVTF